jgi:alkylation response protein AidB-like acyl-CoA dehydrogenase
MIEILASIDAPDKPGKKGFNAGVVLFDDVVVEAAPIIGYMKKKKWTRDQVRDYCAERGWTVTVIYRSERSSV